MSELRFIFTHNYIVPNFGTFVNFVPFPVDKPYRMRYVKDMQTKTKLSKTSVGLIQAVRAEAARRGVSTPELANRVGRNKKFFYDRFNFRKAFSTDDLNDIAVALGITMADIISSARLAAGMKSPDLEVTA